MNKFLFYLAALAMGAAMLAPQGLSAQKRIVKVQGHPHELLTKKWGHRWKAPESKLTQTPTDNINPADFAGCFVDIANLNTDLKSAKIDTAYLLVKFNDGKRTVTGDSIIAWGFRFNEWVISYGDTIRTPVHTIDMIRTVANADTRFSAMLQYTGVSGFSAGGFGFYYTRDDCSRVPLTFNLDSASGNPNITFRYVKAPNCAAGQVAVPVTDPLILARIAVTEGCARGIIENPFNAFYGYPAYDYDYWVLTDPANDNYEWQAGWYKGYWNFFTRNQLAGSFVYADVGISYRQLFNNYVDGFAFSNAYPAPTTMMDGGYVSPNCGYCRSCRN